MKIVFGLGNPGKQYEKTRHNAGFIFLDEFAKKIDASEWKSVDAFKALACTGHIQGEKVILVKPQTFMNLSGYSVGKVFRYYKADIEDVWVIYDDVDLPTGMARMRKRTSGGGGHNGIKSIKEVLGSYGSFARLRLGIDTGVTADYVGGLKDFVLKRFSDGEFTKLSSAIEKGIDALLLAWKEGIHAGMQVLNRKK